jgi:hypothetical protein
MGGAAFVTHDQPETRPDSLRTGCKAQSLMHDLPRAGPKNKLPCRLQEASRYLALTPEVQLPARVLLMCQAVPQAAQRTQHVALPRQPRLEQLRQNLQRKACKRSRG